MTLRWVISKLVRFSLFAANPTDVIMPRSYTKLDDEDVGSLHFGDKTVEGSEKELKPQGEKKSTNAITVGVFRTNK